MANRKRVDRTRCRRKGAFVGKTWHGGLYLPSGLSNISSAENRLLQRFSGSWDKYTNIARNSGSNDFQLCRLE